MRSQNKDRTSNINTNNDLTHYNAYQTYSDGHFEHTHDITVHLNT